MIFDFYFDSVANTPSKDWLNSYIPLFPTVPHPIAIKSDALYLDSGDVGTRDSFYISFDDFEFTTLLNPTTITVSGITYDVVVLSQFTGAPNQINSGLNDLGTAFEPTYDWFTLAENIGTAFASNESLKGEILVSFGVGVNKIDNLKLCDGSDATTVIDIFASPYLQFFVVGAEIGVSIEFSTTCVNATVMQYCFAQYGSVQNLMKMFTQVQFTPIVGFDSDTDVTNGYMNASQVVAPPQIMPFNIEATPQFPTVENPNRLFWFDFAKLVGDYFKQPTFYNQSELDVYESWRNCNVYFGIYADGNSVAKSTLYSFYAIDYYETENATSRAVYDTKTNLFYYPALGEFVQRFAQNVEQPFFTSQKYRPWIDVTNADNCSNITSAYANANLCVWNQGLDGLSSTPEVRVYADGTLVLLTDTSVFGLTFPGASKVTHFDFVAYIQTLVTFSALAFEEIYFEIQSDGWQVTSPIFTNETSSHIEGFFYFKNKFGFLDILTVQKVYKETLTVENEIFTNGNPIPLYTNFSNQTTVAAESSFNIVPVERMFLNIGFLNFEESKEVIKQLICSNIFYFTDGNSIQRPCILENKEQITKQLGGGIIEILLQIRFLQSER